MLEIYQRLVDHFGGQDRTAVALLVNQSTVSGWVRGKHAMSAETAFLAQQKTEGLFAAIELRPSLARVSPTVNQMIPVQPHHQQAVGSAVHPSSNAQASA